MYWPKDVGPEARVTYGFFEVQLEREEVLANYTVRTMKLKHLKVREYTVIWLLDTGDYEIITASNALSSTLAFSLHLIGSGRKGRNCEFSYTTLVVCFVPYWAHVSY